MHTEDPEETKTEKKKSIGTRTETGRVHNQTYWRKTQHTWHQHLTIKTNLLTEKNDTYLRTQEK